MSLSNLHFPETCYYTSNLFFSYFMYSTLVFITNYWTYHKHGKFPVKVSFSTAWSKEKAMAYLDKV